MFDRADDSLKIAFKGIDLSKVRSLTLSGNSYSMDACKWVAENILSKATHLKVLNFSDIFTTRLRNTLPPSLKLLMNAVSKYQIRELNLSHNAFGPDGVSAFSEFLTKCDTLKVLNVTNCGLGPKGGQMIAEALKKNNYMQLKEFYASRDRLEQDGMQALSEVFEKQNCLEKIEVF